MKELFIVDTQMATGKGFMGKRKRDKKGNNKGELERYQFAFFRAMNKSTAFGFWGKQLGFFSKGLIRQRRA
jgi:hypothetical protein